MTPDKRTPWIKRYEFFLRFIEKKEAKIIFRRRRKKKQKKHKSPPGNIFSSSDSFIDPNKNVHPPQGAFPWLLTKFGIHSLAWTRKCIIHICKLRATWELAWICPGRQNPNTINNTLSRKIWAIFALLLDPKYPYICQQSGMNRRPHSDPEHFQAQRPHSTPTKEARWFGPKGYGGKGSGFAVVAAVI